MSKNQSRGRNTQQYKNLRGKVKYLPLAGAMLGAGVSGGANGLKFTGTTLRRDVNLATLNKTVSTKVQGSFGSSQYTNNKDHSQWDVAASLKVGKFVSLSASVAMAKGGAHSDTTKRSGLTYYHASVAGVERLNLQNISLNQLVQSLNQGPRSLLLRCFKEYNNCYNTLSQKGCTLEDVMPQLTQWRKLVDKFYHNYGDEVVISIVWGTLGLVETSTEITDESNKSQFSVKAKLAASGLSVGGSIGGGYSEGDSNSKASTRFSARGIAYGSASEKFVDNWLSKINSQGASTIANVKPLELADNIALDVKLPDPPALKVPAKKSGIAESFGKVKTREEMKQLVFAQGYDSWKNKTIKETIKDKKKKVEDIKADDVSIEAYEKFLESQKAEKDGNDKALNLSVLSENNNTDEAPAGRATRSRSSSAPLRASYAHSAEHGELLTDDEPEQSLGSSFHHYESREDRVATGKGLDLSDSLVPLGMYTTSWANLFPCLGRNLFEHIDESERQIAEQTLEQSRLISSLQTLSDLYTFWAASYDGANATQIGSKEDINQLATDFNRASYLARQGDTERQILNEISAMAETVYQTWKKIPALEAAELGFGALLINDNTPKITDYIYKNKNKNDSGEIDYTCLDAKRIFDGRIVASTFNQAIKVFPIIGVKDQKTSLYGFSAVSDSQTSSSLTFPQPIGTFDSKTNQPYLFELKTNKTVTDLINSANQRDETKTPLSDNTQYLTCSCATANYSGYSIVLIPLSSDLANGVVWSGTRFTSNITGGMSEEISAILEEMGCETQQPMQQVGVSERYIDWFAQTDDDDEPLTTNNGDPVYDAVFGESIFQESSFSGMVPDPRK